MFSVPSTTAAIARRPSKRRRWCWDSSRPDQWTGNGRQPEPGRAPSEAKPEEPPAFTRLLTGAELLALDLKPRFLVRGVLVEGQPMIIGGRSKTLKTSLACDLAVSLGSGKPFLGRFDSHRVAVGFWSGESGAATIRETASGIADSKGVNLADCDVLWCFDLPRLSRLDHLDHLAATIRGGRAESGNPRPVVSGPVVPETASGASNIFLMGSMLQGLTKLGQDTGCTIVLLHHFRKGGQADDENPAGLEELAQSGVAEWARQWILLQRRVRVPGRRQPSPMVAVRRFRRACSLWGVSIDEGLIDPDTLHGPQVGSNRQPRRPMPGPKPSRTRKTARRRNKKSGRANTGSGY